MKSCVPINKNLFDPAEGPQVVLAERPPSTLDEAVQAAQESCVLHRVLPGRAFRTVASEEELALCRPESCCRPLAGTSGWHYHHLNRF